MDFGKQFKKIGEMEKKLLQKLRKSKNIFPTRLLRRGRNEATFYLLVPSAMRKFIKPQKCFMKKIVEKKKIYLVYELKR